MRQFYLTFPIRSTLRSELSWLHYRSLMRVGGTKVRTFYMEKCARAGWSSCQLERQIYDAKYVLYLPTEEELKRELRLDEFEKLEEM